MKVAVYSIAKNEEQHVERWAESAKEADHLFILDTGSEDRTVKAAREAGVRTDMVQFEPWRFDVARNAALKMLPKDIDYCVSLDLDEILIPGWREALEDAHRDGVTRVRYRYVWNFNPDGSEGMVFGGDHIHTRWGYSWKHPVHEVLVPVETFEEVQGWYPLEIHHHADASKSRGQYLPLLELAVQEDPGGDRNIYYLAREYMFHNRPEQAAPMFKRHLVLSEWPAERARSMLYLSTIPGEPDEPWILRACAEAPGRREPWVALAQHLYKAQDWSGCLFAAQRALAIKDRPMDYLNEPWAWGYQPHDLAAIGSYQLGLVDQALMHGVFALSEAPSDERLKQNVAYYREKVGR